MVPATVTRAVMRAEEAAITAWATHYVWTAALNVDALTLRAVANHPVLKVPIRFHADLSGYPAIPPAWTCRDSKDAVTNDAYPKGGTHSEVQGSIYSTIVICAPWNRLAYAVHGGPHGDWGDLANWKSAGANYTQAHTLPDMLDTLRLHLSVSLGVHA